MTTIQINCLKCHKIVDVERMFINSVGTSELDLECGHSRVLKFEIIF